LLKLNEVSVLESFVEFGKIETNHIFIR
jgi:hypothetical protein